MMEMMVEVLPQKPLPVSVAVGPARQTVEGMLDAATAQATPTPVRHLSLQAADKVCCVVLRHPMAMYQTTDA
jgi:hypothetical protein